MAKNLYLFDCFGVVISDVSTLFMQNNGFSAEDVEFMRMEVFRNVDVGKMTMDEMFDVISAKFGIDKEKAVRQWTALESVLPDTVDVIRQLKKDGHCVALLSNAAVSYVDYLFGKFDLRKYFDRLFVSSAYGCAKPDKQFYKLCVDSFTDKFGRIYFTDDNPANLVGLQQFGITPVLFTNACDLKRKWNLK